MLWILVRKELLINLLSLRFALGTAIVVILVAVVAYPLVEEYANRQQIYISEMKRSRKELEGTKVFSKISVSHHIAPVPLSVFARRDRDLPSFIRIDPYHVPNLVEGVGDAEAISIHGTEAKPVNLLLRIFSTIDLSSVVGIVLGLLAIFMVFDSFNGERERGTLPLIMACPVGRLQLLVSKFLGGLITLVIPLLAGFIVVGIIWNLSPAVEVNQSLILGTVTIFLFSIVFLSGFLALGLLVSLYTRESSSGLMLLLLIWIGVAVVIPQAGGQLGELLRPLQTRERALANADQAMEDFMTAFMPIAKGYQPKGTWMSGSTGFRGGDSILGITKEEVYNRIDYNKKMFPLKFELAEKFYRAVEPYERSILDLRSSVERITSLSSTAVYSRAVGTIAGTDLRSYVRLVDRSRRYQTELTNYVRTKVALPEMFTRTLEFPDMEPTEENQRLWSEMAKKEGNHIIYEKFVNWDRVPALDLRDLPKASFQHPSLAERVARALPDMGIMLGTIALLLVVAARRVLTVEVL